MLRREIRLVDLDPARSGESDERRPAGIVSNDGANTTAARLGRGVVTVVPMTSYVARVHPFRVLLPGSATSLDRDSKARAEQVRSISVERISDKIGAVPPALMLGVDHALHLHLAL